MRKQLRVNVSFDYGVNVIEFEPFMGEDIEKYQRAIEDYYYEESKDEDGELVIQLKKCFDYSYFGLEHIIMWFEKVAPNCGINIVEENIPHGREDKSLPYICF